jgi:hypothetical protein
VRGVKHSNEYAAAFGKLYAETPKAVFAAVAFSLCFMSVEETGTDQALAKFMEEWQCLYENGIVPQAPPKQEAPHA